MKTMHLLAGEYGSETGGVGAYSQLLVEALSGRGLPVRVWDVHDPLLRRSLPDALRTQPGYLFLQYVPNILGARGANVAFCQWLLSLHRAGADLRVMFHEPYLYLSLNPALNVLAMVQRLMAGILLRSSSRTYISTEQWQRYLVSYAPAGMTFTVLPIPSTLPDNPSAVSVAEWRSRLSAGYEQIAVHFGTYGDHIANELEPMIPALLNRLEALRFICIGRGSEAFVDRLVAQHPSLSGRVHGTGALDRTTAAAALAAGDIALQPFPDGVTTRRTSVMAPLALGVPTVTSRGFLTENLWREAPSVALATASDAEAHVAATVSLLRDEVTRKQLGDLGRRFYADRFSIERTANILVSDATA
jgi:glycosyltransferase involved in cell wall biosynthesis